MTRPLGIQLFTVREAFADDRRGTLRRLADIGYGAVEPHTPTDNPAAFHADLDEVGLRCSAIHCQLHKVDPEPIFAAARTLGTDHLIVPGGIDHDEFATREGLERTAGLLNRLSAMAAKHDVLVGYHNHWWEFEKKVDGRHALEVLVDLLDPAVFFEIDTYWAAVGGADVPAVLLNLDRRVHALHIKDGPIVRGEPHVAVGQGKMPVPKIVAAAPPQAELVVELDHCATDKMAAAEASHAYLSALVSGEDE